MRSYSNGSSDYIYIYFYGLKLINFLKKKKTGNTFETIDPRNGEVIARVAEGDTKDVDLAVKVARAAFDHGPWPRMSGSERGKIMMKFADLIDQNVEELATLDCLDAGKLFSMGKAVDIPQAANSLRYYAGAADKIHGTVLKMSRPLQAYTLAEPIGVVGAIIPWNYPSTMFFLKVSPALAAGCTIVIKPAEQTPLSALFYAHLAKLAGIPDGVLNVITGFGPTAGAAIASHMDIDMVSFTGSVEIGREEMKASANSNLKPVSLELGGKSPILIFDDADVDTASELALFGFLCNKPLVDELKELWESGLDTCDTAYNNKVFKMRVALLWTVNDFLARSSLYGWSGQGKKAFSTSFLIELKLITPELLSLASKSNIVASSYSACIVNGVQFVTRECDVRLKTHNNGVSVLGTGHEIFYGQLQEILEFSY
ncbi:hypothetical protein UlMin_022281 [Ulmus minor]